MMTLGSLCFGFVSASVVRFVGLRLGRWMSDYNERACPRCGSLLHYACEKSFSEVRR